MVFFFHLIGPESAPTPPDLQLDWFSSASSSENEDEDSSVEVVGTINRDEKVIKNLFFWLQTITNNFKLEKTLIFLL